MISIPVASTFTGTKINIPDQPNLRNVYVQSIDFPQISFDYYGNACLNTVPTYLISLFLTLNVNGYENIHLMPVTELKCANVPIVWNISNRPFPVSGLMRQKPPVALISLIIRAFAAPVSK